MDDVHHGDGDSNDDTDRDYHHQDAAKPSKAAEQEELNECSLKHESR